MSIEVPSDRVPAHQTAPPASVAELVAQFRAGSEEAASALCHRFSGSMRCVIRRKFLTPDAPLRRHMDSMDLLQMVWIRVFAELRHGGTFPDDAAFLRFALTVVRNQFLQEYRANVTTAKRALGKERAFDLKKHDTRETQPDPAAEAESADDWRRLLAGLPERAHLLLLAIRDGFCLSAAAEAQGLNLRTAERIIERLRRTALKRQAARDG